MADWNPNAPNTVGLEWFPTSVVDRTPTSGRAVAMTVDSTAAETIAAAYVGFGSCASAGTMVLDVFETGDEVPGAVTTESFVPNSDLLNVASLWQNQVPNAVNVYQSIDNGVVNEAVYAGYLGTYTQKGSYAVGFGTAGWAANRRVLAIRFVFSAAATNGNYGRLQPIFRAGSTSYNLGLVTLSGEPTYFTVDLGELDPSTGLPWTEAGIEALDTTAGFGWRALSGATTAMRVYDARIEIDWVTEDRVAVGVTTFGAFGSDTGPLWATFALIAPNTGVANWSKANATTYTFVVRPVAPLSAGVNGIAQASAAVRTLDNGTALPTGSVGYQPTLDSSGAVVTLGDADTFGMALALDVNASATDSVDGMPYIQPYLTFASVGVGDGRVMAQELSGATNTASYELLRIVLGFPTSTDNTDSVQVSVHRRSDDVQIGSTVNVTAADVRAGTFMWSLSDVLYNVGVDSYVFPVVNFYQLDLTVDLPLANATQYYVQVSTQDFVGYVGGVFTDDYLNDDHGNPATYGGTTDTLIFDGAGGGPPATALDSADLLVTLSTIPEPVESFSFTTEQFDTAQAGCNPTLIPYTRLAWEPTSLGADFDHYQIDRTIDGGTTWQTIGHITTEAVAQYEDKEAPFATVTQYRIRVVRTGDLIPSDWTTSAEQTIDAPECVLYFTSNLYDVQLAYNPGDRITYDWTSSDETEIVAPTGADYQTALIPAEWRGDTFDVDLSVWLPSNRADRAPGGENRWTFDPLIAMSRAVLPYVCVRDDTGRVWYANINPVQGTHDHRAAVPSDTAQVVVTELTATPAVVDVTVDSDVLLLDYFNRANTANIDGSSPNVGDAWDTVSFTGGTIGILGGRAYASAIDMFANIAFNEGAADGWAEAEYTYAPITAPDYTVPLAWRGNVGALTAWQVTITGPPNTLNVSRDGSVIYYSQPITFATGQTVTFRAEYSGNYHRVLVDGEVLVEIVDSTYQTETGVGFGLNAANNFVNRIAAGAWPTGTEANPLLNEAGLWLDARTIDTGWVAADNWANLGTVGPSLDAVTQTGAPPDLTPTFVEPGDTDGPGFDATDTGDILGGTAHCFDVPNGPVLEIPTVSGGRTVTFVVTPTLASTGGNKMGWTYSAIDLPSSQDGWVVEYVPAIVPPNGPLVAAGASAGPVFAAATYNNMIYGKQVWTFTVDRATDRWALYRDGFLLSENTLNGLGDATSASPLQIGRNYVFHQVVVHDTALTDDEVAALADELAEGPTFPQPEPTYTPTLYTG